MVQLPQSEQLPWPTRRLIRATLSAVIAATGAVGAFQVGSAVLVASTCSAVRQGGKSLFKNTEGVGQSIKARASARVRRGPHKEIS